MAALVAYASAGAADAAAATPVSQATATDLSLALGNGTPAVSIPTPPTSATNDGSQPDTPVTAQPAPDPLSATGQDFLTVGSLADVAEASSDGSSYACAGVIAPGGQLQVGPGGSSCSASTPSGATGLTLDLGKVPGLATALASVADVRVSFGALSSFATETASGQAAGSATFGAAAVTITLAGLPSGTSLPVTLPSLPVTLPTSLPGVSVPAVTVPGVSIPGVPVTVPTGIPVSVPVSVPTSLPSGGTSITIPFQVSAAPNQDLLGAVIQAISGSSALAPVASALSSGLSGAGVSLVTNFQRRTSAGAFEVSALHLGLPGGGTGDLAEVTVGPNQAPPAATTTSTSNPASTTSTTSPAFPGATLTPTPTVSLPPSPLPGGGAPAPVLLVTGPGAPLPSHGPGLPYELGALAAVVAGGSAIALRHRRGRSG